MWITAEVAVVEDVVVVEAVVVAVEAEAVEEGLGIEAFVHR